MMDPPVPIPNTAVKRHSAHDTAPARVWENRSPPGDYFIRNVSSNDGAFLRLMGISRRLAQTVFVDLIAHPRELVAIDT